MCHNCTRRNNECEYDAVPKRRGPDKRPGTRKRSCKKRPPDSEPSLASARKKRKVHGDLDGNLISFDVKVKENVTSSPERSTFLSRSPGDDPANMTIPQSMPLVLDPCITHRTVAPDIMYPKVSVICSLVCGATLVDRYLCSASRTNMPQDFDAIILP